jgi:hypothetical protein
MKTVKPALVACFVLAVLACKDANSFQPFDPTKSDPPAPPELIQPGNDWMSDHFGCLQEVCIGHFAQTILQARIHATTRERPADRRRVRF